jgi:N-acetylglucosaminyldiphosphoundecaprenol N-acetyl-beta-D-mannosaminyltransferase
VEYRSAQTFRLLKTAVADYTMKGLVDEVQEGVKAKDGRVIAHHNLHSLYLFHRRKSFRNFYEKVVSSSPIDGMPIIWIARLYGYQIPRDRRLTYVDFLPPLLEAAAEKRWRIFYLGSRPDVCAQGSQMILDHYPGIELEASDGYFDADRNSDGNRHIVEKIASFKPDVLLVGMGMPRQEEWIAANYRDLGTGVILPCGAAIDYIAGAIPTPPRWAGRMGLEWLFRLCAEPRRLASRYLIEPWFLLGVLILDLSSRRRSPAQQEIS